MKRILPLTILISLLCSCSAEQQADQQASNDTAADSMGQDSTLLAAIPADDDPESSTFQTLDGRGFDVEDLAGKKVFVNFWATWCAPCIREIPSINRAAAELAAEGIEFLFVSDEDIETIDEFLLEREFQGNFVKLNGYVATYGISAMPTSWLLDENGDVLTTWAGAYEWDSAEMIDEIRTGGL